jgi:hypothetical protein
VDPTKLLARALIALAAKNAVEAKDALALLLDHLTNDGALPNLTNAIVLAAKQEPFRIGIQLGLKLTDELHKWSKELQNEKAELRGAKRDK